jgi:hypothetical protein
LSSFLTTQRVLVITLLKMGDVAGSLVAIGSAAARLIWHAFQASIHVEINNKCSNFELTSPVCFNDGAVCEMPLDQSVAPDNSMKTRFRAYLSRTMFRGVILYELRATSTSPANIVKSNSDHTCIRWPHITQ